MSVWVSQAECERLYQYDPSLMFGCAVLNGEPTIFLARLLPRDVVGGDDIDNRRSQFLVIDIPQLLHVQNRKGEPATRKDYNGMVLTLVGWPGQTHGNAAVLSGAYTSLMIRYAKPPAVALKEYRDSVAAAGREQDRFIKEKAEEMADEFKFLSKQSSPNTKLISKEEIKEQIESPLGQKIEKFRQNDPSVSSEQRYLKNNGLT